jgi:serine phosphatase RsbU (regulator of sigma subunit)
MSRKKQEKQKSGKREKRRSLLVQIGILFAVIFLVVIPAFVVIQVVGNTRTYMEAKREHLTPIMKNVQRQEEKSIKNLEWFVPFWMEHRDEIRERASGANGEEAYASYISFDDEDITPDMLDKLSEEEKLNTATAAYRIFCSMLALQQWTLVDEQLFIIDVHKETFGYLYDKAQNVESDDFIPYLGMKNWKEGETIPNCLVAYLLGKSQEVMFERMESRKNGLYYYWGFYPVVKNGQIMYVIGILHDWSEYHSTLIKNLNLLIVISVAILISAGAILLHFVYRAAVRPVKKIQYAVRDYRKDKDSASIIQKLNRILQKNELGDLALDVSDMVEEIERYNEENTKLIGERQRVETELSLAATIQNGVLPKVFPEEKDYRLFASMKPAKEVGGDFYDFFNIDENHVGLVIGDVSGKGVPASLFMMITKMLIKQHALSGYSPADVLEKTNAIICSENESGMFVTAWFGIMDRRTGVIVATSAGHEFPMIKEAGGEFTLFKDKHGFVLGGMDDSKYKEYEITLTPGSTFFIYTDGAAEATNIDDELFGTDRMLDVLNEAPDRSPEELCKAMEDSAMAFTGEAPQFDDLTLLCVRYDG